jgi:dihydrofolate synthase/folylpolyglutamate synthase
MEKNPPWVCFAPYCIEVGMGGSWDATNLITPEVSIITSIDIDHTEYLGNTLESIASEKAGIIKPEVPVVSHEQFEPAEDIILSMANKLLAPVLLCTRDFDARDFDFDGKFTDVSFSSDIETVNIRKELDLAQTDHDHNKLAMRGYYQIDNMMASVVAVESIFGPLDDKVLNDTFTQMFVPGRLQQISQEPAIVVDIAHNPAGVAVMAQAVREYFDYDYLISVVGILQEKDVQPMLTTFVELADYLVLTQSQSPRALPVDQLVKLLPADFSSPNFETAENVTQALAQAVTKLEKFQLEHPEQKGLILISGSATVVGETLALLEPGA